jgi:transcriptional regulator with XRE-family HTH domain
MKEYVWPDLIRDIISNLRMTQCQLADKCMVTQQSISNWKKGSRKPGMYAQDKIFILAKQANLELSDYLSDFNVSQIDSQDMLIRCLRGLSPEQKKITMHMLLTLTEDFRQLNLEKSS